MDEKKLNNKDEKNIEYYFEEACQFVKKKDPLKRSIISQENQLKLYGLYKQATVGNCSDYGGERPGFFNFEGRAKWDNWNALGNMESQKAKYEYCKLMFELHSIDLQCLAPMLLKSQVNSDVLSFPSYELDQFKKAHGNLLKEDWIKGKLYICLYICSLFIFSFCICKMLRTELRFLKTDNNGGGTQPLFLEMKVDLEMIEQFIPFRLSIESTNKTNSSYDCKIYSLGKLVHQFIESSSIQSAILSTILYLKAIKDIKSQKMLEMLQEEDEK